jgi:hypothetical protein
LISLALDGDLGAIGGIADRLDGKPRQVVENSRRLTLERAGRCLVRVAGNHVSLSFVSPSPVAVICK